MNQMANVKKIADKGLISNEELEVYKGFTTFAAKARFLLSLGKTRGDISRFMTETEGKEIRYQWIRNIELTPLKKRLATASPTGKTKPRMMLSMIPLPLSDRARAAVYCGRGVGRP